MAFPAGETSTELGPADVPGHLPVGASESAEWKIDPYSGCELGCVFCPGQRERLLRHAGAAFPQSAARIRRVLGRRTPDAEQVAARELDFCARCRALGLLSEEELVAGGARTSPAQLPLFSTPPFR